MSLLTIVQTASAEIGLPVPSSVINNSNDTVKQMLYLVNSIGRELAQHYDWQELVNEGSFTTVATETQSTIAAATTGFHRFVNNTMFDRTRNWQIIGPLSAQDWQFMKSTSTQSVRNYWRVRGDSILFYPTPSAGNSVYFEYVTENWADVAATGSPKSSFTIDTDISLIDEELLKRALVYRWLEMKGLDYAEPFRRYQLQLSNSIQRNGAKPVLSTVGRPSYDPSRPNIPDGSFTL